MKTKILNVPFDVVTKDEALNILLSFLEADKNNFLATPNPEIVMACRKDEGLLSAIKSAELVVPDGIGIVYASKLNKIKIKERVPGFDLIVELLSTKRNSELTVYLLGGKSGVAKLAKENIEKTYKQVKVVGFSDGYFDSAKEKIIIETIKKLKPQLLLVCLGASKQERWISDHKDLPVKISAGVGGTIDIFAGTVTRAPKVFQKLGLEWLYRLLKQPTRIGRMLQLPKFVVIVLLNKFLNIA